MEDNSDRSERHSFLIVTSNVSKEKRAVIKHEWIVFCGSLFASFLNFGFMASMGAMFIGMLDTFNAGRGKTALVQSLVIAWGLGFGVVGGFLINKFGIRIVTYIAAPLAAIGLFLSCFATSIEQLYGFISVLSSVGLTTMSVSAVTCVGWTFTGRRKLMVLALQSLGSAISGLMWPFVLTASIERYSFRGACLVLCGVLLNNIPIAIIFSNCKVKLDAPVKERTVSDMTVPTIGKVSNGTASTDREGQHNAKCVQVLYSTPIKNKLGEIDLKIANNKTHIWIDTKKEMRLNESKQGNQVANKENIKTSKWSNIFGKACLNRSVWLYFIFVLSVVLTMSALIGFLVVYQDINVSNGLSVSQSDLSFMCYALMNILSRLLPIIPARFSNINSFSVPLLSSLAGVCGQLMFLTQKSFEASIVSMGLTSVSDGGLMASLQSILFQILPPKYQAIGLGFMFTSIGVSSAAIGPIFGSIRDRTSSYHAVLITTTILMSAGAMLSFVCLILSSNFVQRNLRPSKMRKEINNVSLSN